MLLAIDIGNTNTVVGLFDGPVLKNDFRFASRHNRTSDEAGILISDVLNRVGVQPGDIKRAIIASVVPPLTQVYETAVREYFAVEPLVVTHKIKLPLIIEIDQPEQVGADRIANAAAGFDKFGGPVIVVDFGTATTFDVVNEKGAYIGGVIIPGPETSMAELARKAARLFEVRIEPPDSVVGKSTAGALKSGLFYGTVGQVDFIIEKIIEETGFKKTKIVATGGLAPGIEKYSRFIKQVEQALTLEGLRLISNIN
ncbi:MAG: type III pantothenate kinase [candidate division Zixibacteria bacterium]|nr:type III pantothenate kinase [candidate division Zixibacteria bacterium]